MFVSRIRPCDSEQTPKKKSGFRDAEDLDSTGKSLHGDNTSHDRVVLLEGQ